jgi:hypothetical protein
VGKEKKKPGEDVWRGWGVWGEKKVIFIFLKVKVKVIILII